jgi:hypothetical protein
MVECGFLGAGMVVFFRVWLAGRMMAVVVVVFFYV